MNQTLISTLRKPNFLRNIFFTSVLAGTLDAITAIFVYNADPGNMFRFIASGAFGREAAFAGGADMIIWGVLFHYFIALSWAILFFAAYPFVQRYISNKYVLGVGYGILVWVMMNLVILPFTKIPTEAFYIDRAVIGATILVLMIGLPISLLTHRYYSRT